VDHRNKFVPVTGEWNLLPGESLDFLFEDHPLPSWIYDAVTLRFLRVNVAATEQYGYSREEFLTVALPDILNEDIQAFEKTISSECEVIQDSAVWRHQRKDKSALSVRVSSRGIQYAGRPAMMAVVCEIQAPTAFEEALATSERLLRSVWENATDSMRITDQSGTVIRVNEAYCRFAGLPAENLENHPFWIIYPEADQPAIRARYQERFQKASFAAVAEHSVTLWNGGKVRLELSNSQLRTDQGTRILTIHRDITERQLSQERLCATVAELERAKQQSDAANRAKSAFLANMSHEIRTPMNGILGLADLALQEPDEEKRREYLQFLKSSAEGLMDVLNDILDLSKIEAQQMSIERVPFSITECVQRAMATLLAPARSKGLTLSCDIGADIPAMVIGDPVRMRQILLNLIGNAIKFTAQGYVRLSAVLAGEAIRFTIEDTGIGISSGQQKAIFEPFQQADISTTRTYGGTGLGLSIVAALVKLMNGKIWLESQPGMGAIFHVEVLLTSAAAAAASVEEPAGRPNHTDLRCLNILVAEDNPINQLVTSRLLEREGHHVTVASDGRAVLADLEQGHFDLVLMDVQMPVMDGLQATRAIRAKEGAMGKRLPIIALTAHAMRGDEEALISAGIDAYVPKPVCAQQLFKTIAEVLSRAEDVSGRTYAAGLPGTQAGSRLHEASVEDRRGACPA
jgi:PAS domain S-box-containing protein